LVSELSARIRDVSNARWTTTEKLWALNAGLRGWSQRVSIPFLYELPDVSTNTSQYDLPYYVTDRLEVETIHSGTDSHWNSTPSWSLTRNPEGGYTLILPNQPSSKTARVIWWDRNSPLPVG